MRTEPSIPPDSKPEGVIDRALVVWVRITLRHRRLVIWSFTATTLALLVYTALELGVNASHTALLSDDLEFWQQYTEFAEAFPIVDETLFVVVDADSALRARRSTQALADRLEATSSFTSVYVPGGGEYFEKHGLLYLSVDELNDLTDHLASVQPWLAELAQDRSLTTLVRVLEQGIEYAEGDPVVADNVNAVFDSVSLAAEAVLEGRPKPISWDELLVRRSMPGDSARQLILLETDFDYETLLPAEHAIALIRQTALELGLTPERGVTVRITGNVALNYEEMIGVARGSVAAIAGSLVVVGLILWAAFGSRRLVVATLATLLVGLAWTAAFAALAVGRLNVISVTFAVLFIGLGVDFGIHLCMRFAELTRQGSSLDHAILGTVRSVGGSLALCALTTAIGFFVFIPTDYRAVGELGLIAGTGMPISLFCSLTLLPAILAGTDPKRIAETRPAPEWFTEALVPLAIRYSGTVLIASAVAGVAALLALPHLRFDHNVARLRDSSTESAQTFEDLLTESDTSPWTMDAIAPTLADAEQVAARLASLPFVERAVTLADYVPSEQEEKLEILSDLSFIVPNPVLFEESTPKLPLENQIAALRGLREIMGTPWLQADESGGVESARSAGIQLDRLLERLESLSAAKGGEAIDQFESSLLGELPDQIFRLWKAMDAEPVDLANLPRDLSRRLVNEDGRARIEILPSEDLGDTAAIERFVDGVRAELPNATGSAVTILEWARATVLSFQQALTAAIIAVTLVVWILWRRVGDLLLVISPLLLAALLTAASAAVVGIEFNFVNVAVLPLLLGIGIDSGIHLVHRHREARQQYAADPAAPITAADAGDELLATSTAHAVFFSASTTMASFGSLALAGHGGISSLGQLLLLGLVLTLVCNLVVLPALISRFENPSSEPAAG